MIYIDFEGKTPANTPSKGAFTQWTDEEWQAWESKSQEYLERISALNNLGDIVGRNAFIDSKSSHWGKLKRWLISLSDGKCWFSEVRELYSHYDVEHFRPKKERKELSGETYDGYWWLAFDYTNFRLCGNVGNRKKGGWFPLKEGSLSSTYDCPCEESETSYLLDPTSSYDPHLLAFDEEGKAIPSPSCQSEWEKERAVQTIARLKLSEHEMLSEERKKIWQSLSREIDLYLTAKSRLSAGCNPAARTKVQEHLKNIKKFTAPDSELSSVARWCLFFRNDPLLLKLVS